MARTGVTFEEVQAAADALVGRGEAATIKAVRESLGSGSPNTIHRHLTAWRAARPNGPSGAGPDLPPALARAIGAEIARAAAEARAEAEAKLAQAQAEAAELAAAGEALEAERDGRAARLAEADRERDKAEATAAERQAEVERQAREIERERTAAEQARIEAAQGRHRLETHEARVTWQGGEINRLQGILEGESKARVAAERQAAVLAAKLEAATDRAAQAEARAADLAAKTETGRDQARQEAAAAREAAAHARGQLEAAQAQQAALLAALRDAGRKTEDARKAAMVGAALLAKVERGEWPRDKMLAMMDATLTGAGERALFGLDGKKPGEGGKPPAKPRTAKARNLDTEDT